MLDAMAQTSDGGLSKRIEAMAEKAAGAKKGRQTQWATQFLAASELIRRGYTVSFTQGNNTPVADLMVGSPSSELFWIDVKGLSSRNAWLINPKEPRAGLFYILILLSPNVEEPNERKPDRFFVMTQAEAAEAEAAYMKKHPNDRGLIRGFGFAQVEQPGLFENRWDKLPR
ncbi:MAG: hypothetical protein JSS36_06320 [Proteobacteria bacterium]|nr:hypothetical protein [Pseudomonadota bacterium]